MNYLDIRNGVVEQIKKAFSTSKKFTVKAHPGRFNEGEVRRLMQRTPAILTSLMSIKDSDIQDECSIEFVSWVLYRASNQDRLYSDSILIVSKLIGAIKNIDLDISYGGGTDITAECLYSGSLDKINATLWAVRWTLNTRGVEAGANDIALSDSLEDFKGYDSELIVGQQQADDVVNLE